MMIVEDKKEYNMVINENGKELRVQVLGFIRAVDTEGFMNDLQDMVKKVYINDYTLVIDAAQQTTTPSRVVPQLEQIMKYYSSLGFKNVFVIKPSSKIAQVQIRNVMERIEFSGTMVDHF